MFAKRRARTERLLTATVVFLVVGLCASLYVVLRVEKPGSRNIEIPATTQKKVTHASAPITEADLAALWTGRDPEKPSDNATPPPPPPASDGRPKCIVRGIVYSTTAPSVAFIEIAKTLGLFREGQLADGWRIEKIERDAVTFVRDDASYRIPVAMASYAARPWIPDPKSAARADERGHSSNVASSPPPYSRSRNAGRTIPVADAGVTIALPKSSSAAPRPADADATVAVPSDLVEQARTDPRSLMGDVKAGFSTGSDGRVNGVILNQVPTGSLAARYGFAPGDRIVAVNGQPLKSYAQASRLYARYRNDNSATVTIERNGVRKNVVYYAR